MKNKSKIRSQKVAIDLKVQPCNSTENISKENNVSKMKSNDSNSSANTTFPSSNQSDLKDLQPVTINNTIKIPEQFSNNEFLPVTSETLQHVLSEIKRLSSDSRLVLIVFNECFTKPNLKFNMIKSLLEPVVGQLDNNCVLLKSSLSKLMPNIAETYAKEFKILNQAYVICPKGKSEEEVARRASERNILYGFMTFSCVLNSVQTGTCFVNKEALLATTAAAINSKPNLKRTIEQQTSKKAQDITIPKGSNRKPSSSSKNSKTADNVVENLSRADTPKGHIRDSCNGNQTKNRHFVSEILSKLTTLGDLVLRIDHLPSQISINSLNILLGCNTLERDQVIAANRREKDSDAIDVHIVCQSHSYASGIILKLHDQEIGDKIKLQVRPTSFKKLELYLLENHKKIFKLEVERSSPLKVIGYGNKKSIT